MKKVILTSAIVIMVLGLGITFADKPGNNDDGYNGNGAPSGKHTNINIIGVNPKKDDWSGGGNSGTIFVSRTGQTRFYVGTSSSNNINILDHNGTDGQVGTGDDLDPNSPDYSAGIEFPYSNDEWQVEIWVRLLGPKNSKIDWASSYWDDDDDIWVEFAAFTLDRVDDQGKIDSKFQLKTSELLKDGYENILWELDPVTKFRHLQMRVYLTNVEE